MTRGIAAGALAGLAFLGAARPAALAAQAPGVRPPAVVPRPGPRAPSSPVNAIAAPGETARIAVGEAMQGELEPGDRLMADSTLADVWEFEGTAGESVTVEVHSDEFDTFLEVLDAAGTLLAQDDDSGGDFNSRLALTLPASGTYQIVVNNAGHERRAGRYVLSVR